MHIAQARKLPPTEIAQCQAACDDKNKLGHALAVTLAIVRLGRTRFLEPKDLDTEQQQRKWEHITFVPATDLKNMNVTAIKEVHPIQSPWTLRGQQKAFRAWMRLEDLPPTLNPDILKRRGLAANV